MSDRAIDYTPYQVRHAGIEPGGGNTTRVNLWFNATPTHQLMMFLDGQADGLKIQGIAGVVQVHGNDHVKAQLIIEHDANVSTTAAMWIEAFNTYIASHPEQLAGLNDDTKFVEAIASPSSSRGSDGTRGDDNGWPA